MSVANFPLPQTLEEMLELLNKPLPDQLPNNFGLAYDSRPGQVTIKGGDGLPIYQAASREEAFVFLSGVFLQRFGGNSVQTIHQETMTVAERHELTTRILQLSHQLLTERYSVLLRSNNTALIPHRAELVEVFNKAGLPVDLVDDVVYVVHRFCVAPASFNIEDYRDLVGHKLSKPDRDSICAMLKAELRAAE